MQESQVCRNAQQKWIEDKTEEAVAVNKLVDSRSMYRIIKELAGKTAPRPVSALEQKMAPYCQKMYSNHQTQTTLDRGSENEPDVLIVEIERAIKTLKNNKATGTDEIPAEALKVGGQTVVESIKYIIDSIWMTGIWPEDWTVSEMITLPKVANTLNQPCIKDTP